MGRKVMRPISSCGSAMPLRRAERPLLLPVDFHSVNCPTISTPPMRGSMSSRIKRSSSSRQGGYNRQGQLFIGWLSPR